MGKELVITKEIAVKAILFGSCRIPEIGKNISELSTSDLIWAERLLPINRIELDLPLWVMAGSGSGDGYGKQYNKLPQLLNKTLADILKIKE